MKITRNVELICHGTDSDFSCVALSLAGVSHLASYIYFYCGPRTCVHIWSQLLYGRFAKCRNSVPLGNHVTQPESVSQDGGNLLRPDKSDVIALQVTRIERIRGKLIAKSNLNSHTGIVSKRNLRCNHIIASRPVENFLHISG